MAKLIACPERLRSDGSDTRRANRGDIRVTLESLRQISAIGGWDEDVETGKFSIWWLDDADRIEWEFSSLQEIDAWLWGVQYKRPMGPAAFGVNR